MSIFRKRENASVPARESYPRADFLPGDKEGALVFLRELFNRVRPPTESPEKGGDNLRALMAAMDADPSLEEGFTRAVSTCLDRTDLMPLLTESGMALSRSLGRELNNRIKHKLLPPVRMPHDFLQVIDTVFHDGEDYLWVERIPTEDWNDFISRLRISPQAAESTIGKQVLRAMDVLAVRAAKLGCEREVSEFLPELSLRPENPFMWLQQTVRDMHREPEPQDGFRSRGSAAAAREALAECDRSISYIRSRTHEKGASLAQTYLLYQLQRLLGRITLLLDLVDGDDTVDSRRLAGYFVRVVRNQNRKYSIREFLTHTTGFLAYQIAEQKGRKGGDYITHTRREYRLMFYRAMKGGLIVSVVALFKNLLALMQFAPFWQGITYSVNYSAGFLVIDQTGATLATKQPAFTANAVAGTIDESKARGGSVMQDLVQTLAKVSRSQIASFVGNLIMVFPGTYLLAWLFDLVFGFPIAAGERAMNLLRDQHPTRSLALLYACNTGVFLFLSGIIAGYVQNKMQYGRIAERIRLHPGLQSIFTASRLTRIAAFCDRNAGAVMGSIALGFFLGMAGTVGRFFGIPFDIRHITIAAGNTSIGLYGLGLQSIPRSFLAMVLLGVAGIGFLNFLVSFALAFHVAMRSRGLRMKDVPGLPGMLWRHFRSHPLDFFRPPATARRRYDEMPGKIRTSN